MSRLEIIRELFNTASDFMRLEKVEIGGVKGKALSSHVIKIFEEFKEEFEKFGNKKYDPLDPKSEVKNAKSFKIINIFRFFYFFLNIGIL